MLGQIAQINRNDISLSLPNNLTGYVPLTSISDIVTKKVEDLAKEIIQSDGEDEDDDDDAESQLDLAKMFTVGSYVRANVISTRDETVSGAKGKKHIELSIKPQEANAGLSQEDLVPNSMVQAAVVSAEDHGLIMDLGLEGSGVRGFMSSKELGPGMDASKMQQGSVHLCLILGKSSNGKIIKLSMDSGRIANIKKGSFVSDAPSVGSFLPGTAVDVLITDVSSFGVIGKVMGLLNVTADSIHSGSAASGKELAVKYPIGSKAKGRLLFTFPSSDEKKLGISMQDHILYWRSKTVDSTTLNVLPTQSLQVSSIVEDARIAKVEPGVGLYLDIGVKGVRGFAHISRISDSKIDTLSETTGRYKLGSTHKARIIGYNSMDGLFILSLEQDIINQAYLRIEDVRMGEVVKATIEKLLVNAEGVSGAILNIAKGITGLVPEMHLADIRLQHPERKFREGMTVLARVLSVDPFKRQIRFTMKKSIVNSDAEPWTSYNTLEPGMQSPGTIINVLANGAVVQFFGSVRAFLPVAEMSESFIQDPRQHFHKGQLVNVHITSIDASEGRLTVSCRDALHSGRDQEELLKAISVGSLMNGDVVEKANEQIIIQLEKVGMRATLPFEHLTDGSTSKAASAAKKIRVGQTLQDLVILSKPNSKGLVGLTTKPSLVKAAQEGRLINTLDDVREDTEVLGFVNNVSPIGVFVRFGGDLTGLLLKRYMHDGMAALADFGCRRDQSISTRVLSVDRSQGRFLLTNMAKSASDQASQGNKQDLPGQDGSLLNAVDEVSTSIRDFTLNKITKARVVSIKETQVNVHLADGVQGRIDVSEIYDNWEEIPDRKYPLKKFHTKQIIPVRILGMHDARNHRFLPITHRQHRSPVFELTAKPSSIAAQEMNILTLDKVKINSSWLVAVNNVADDCLWVNLSPNVRGRLRAMDVSDDVSMLKDLATNFPVGSMLKAKVTRVDIEQNRLDLTARSNSSKTMTLQDFSPGMVIPGRVTKVTERQVMVQLSESISGAVHLVDVADDYQQANLSAYQKNQTVRVCIKDIDTSNEKLALSTRPSKILSSSLPVRDPDILSISQLKVNDVVRGFIKNVADNGVFVTLASNVTAFIRVSDLSDSFIKDWKSDFEVNQLVEGKVIAVDPLINHVQMSLKRSHLDATYKPPLTFVDMKVGQIVTGKVRKVEVFGVFIVVDDSANVSGLCHRTKMSDGPGADPRKLYEEGDAVKAKVLHINKEKRQISFGLKASYISAVSQDSDQETGHDARSQSPVGSDDAEEFDGDRGGVALQDAEHSELYQGSDDDIELDGRNVNDIDSQVDGDAMVDGGPMHSMTSKIGGHDTDNFVGLSAGGFDWSGDIDSIHDDDEMFGIDIEAAKPKKKTHGKAGLPVDRTGDLDANGPQSVADFERLLLGQPNSSVLWLSYMAFQLQVSETEQAREIAERALKTINIREEHEKFNIWIAMLNLENAYGTENTLDDVFKRACEYNDGQEIHEHLTSIYIQSGHHQKADDLFQTTLKKYSQTPSLYLNYATFLMTTLSAPDRARALLPRAMQALPSHTHLSLTSKFAQLEFKHGDAERGRTLFETLLSQWPKRLDLWNVLIDMEISHGGDDMAIVRRLFERITGPASGLKPRKAKFFFKRWLDFEVKKGDKKSQEKVTLLAADYVKQQGQGQSQAV